MSLEDFIFGYPAQIALLGIQYQWTADTQVRMIVGAARSLAEQRPMMQMCAVQVTASLTIL